MHRQKAPFFVVVFLGPSSDGSDVGCTTVPGSEVQLRRSEVSRRVFRTGGQQVVRCETSKSPTTTPVATIPSLPQGCERGESNPRDNGARSVAFGHDADHDMAPVRPTTLEGGLF